jgi:hypothetical protein
VRGRIKGRRRRDFLLRFCLARRTLHPGLQCRVWRRHRGFGRENPAFERGQVVSAQRASSRAPSPRVRAADARRSRERVRTSNVMEHGPTDKVCDQTLSVSQVTPSFQTKYRKDVTGSPSSSPYSSRMPPTRRAKESVTGHLPLISAVFQFMRVRLRTSCAAEM